MILQIFLSKNTGHNFECIHLIQMRSGWGEMCNEEKIESSKCVGILLLKQFEAGEDADLSRDVTVELDKLFKSFTISAVEEVTLGANLNIEKLHRFSDTINFFDIGDQKH